MVVQLTNWLHGLGDKIAIALILESGEFQKSLYPEIPIYNINRKGRFDLRAAKELSALIQDFDVVHVHMRHNFRYISFIKFLYPFRAKIVFHDHFGKIEVDPSIPFGFKTIFRPEIYIGVSDHLTKWASQRLRLKDHQIHLLENTIQQCPSVNVENREGLVLVSNIKVVKNQKFSVNVLSKLNQNLKLTFFGNIYDNTYYQEILTDIKKSNLENRFSFIHNNKNIQSELGNFLLGLHTSTSESGPLVLLEYLAQHLPFLAYKTGNIANKLSLEFPEYFISNFDTEEWVWRIKSLLNSPPDLEKMQAVFEKHFSEKVYIETCREIYKNAQAY